MHQNSASIYCILHPSYRISWPYLPIFRYSNDTRGTVWIKKCPDV